MDIDSIRRSVYELKQSKDNSRVADVVISAARELPKTPDALDILNTGFELLARIEHPYYRRIAYLDFSKEIPCTEAYKPFYIQVMDTAIAAADEFTEKQENHRRTTELLRLANALPKTKDFMRMRAQAWRLALGLSDKPCYRDPDLARIAKELPKSSDVSFYKGYTLLGVAKSMPRDGALFDVYKDAMELAIKAVAFIDEPYYRKYALDFIAKDLCETPELHPLYKKAFEDSYKAALDMTDPFAREYAIIEIIREVPKTQEFFPMLQDALEQGLSFFTVKKWMEDVEVLDVVDYILSAEEAGMNESKKNRFTREKYSKRMSEALDKIGAELNDIRLIQTLSPYTHVWVQPRELRDAVRKVVEQLEKLKITFHGREITRPVFVKEVQLEGEDNFIHMKDRQTNECISIDLGATNTVIMRKRGDSPPEYVDLPEISRKFESMYIVPTILSPESNTIGTAVVGGTPIADLKQMLLDGNPKGRAYMERFFRILYQHLKKATFAAGWLFSKNTTDKLYITVPVGYQDYRGAMKEIAEATVKGSKAEFIEEPLAAAVGYEVVDDRDKVIMVIDFGGSTLNTMIVRLNINEVHVIAKPERAQILGGHDIDVWLAEHLAAKADIPYSGEMPYSLLVAAEDIKIELSKRLDARFIWEGKETARITRQELEEVLDKHEFYSIIDRTISYVLRRAEKIGLKKDGIEAVLLTGGSSQIPSFKDKVGHIFPNLRKKNLIYDHSPLSAVGLGAALYGTRDISDRHLGMAYALKYVTSDKESPYAYTIVLEKGETLPLEKTFKMKPARKLALQSEIYLELFEVPESMIARRWVSESGIEFIKQELSQPGKDLALKSIKTVSLPFKEPIEGEVLVTMSLSQSGELSLRYGADQAAVNAGIKLQ